ncbi:MAG: hypothetical protein IPI35_26950 [Deltaproteobacteria bacterium]|nr:hypothetical protein [Deltaproteobacteria bacterium]
MHVNPNAVTIHAVNFWTVKDRRPKAFTGSPLALIGQHRAWHDKKDAPCFSTVTYRKRATRGNEGVMTLTALVMDYDHLTAEQTGFVFDQSAPGPAWPTAASATIPASRTGWSFRLMLFLDRPIAAAEHAGLWRW